jgi:hypothetical protein
MQPMKVRSYRYSFRICHPICRVVKSVPEKWCGIPFFFLGLPLIAITFVIENYLPYLIHNLGVF